MDWLFSLPTDVRNKRRIANIHHIRKKGIGKRKTITEITL